MEVEHVNVPNERRSEVCVRNYARSMAMEMQTAEGLTGSRLAKREASNELRGVMQVKRQKHKHQKTLRLL